MNNEVEETIETESPSLFGMITSPGQQFKRIRNNPKIILALIIVTIMAIVASLLSLSGMESALEEEFMGLVDDELMIIMVLTQIVTVVLAMFVPALIILVSASVFLLIARIGKFEVSFKQLFSLFTYITFISSIGGLINSLYFFLVENSNPELAITSLNVFFNYDGVAGIVYSSIEIFSIWSIILTAIGLQVVAKFPKALAWGIIIGFNLIIMIIGIMLVVASQSFGI